MNQLLKGGLVVLGLLLDETVGVGGNGGMQVD